MIPRKEPLSRLSWLFPSVGLLLMLPWLPKQAAWAGPPGEPPRSKGAPVPPPDPPPSLPAAPTVEPSQIEEDPRATEEDPPDKPPANPLKELRQICKQARDRYAAMDSYIVRLRRREQINGKDHAEEIMALKFRKQPWSVYWPRRQRARGRVCERTL